jgi:hypothetical protein
MVGAQLEGFDTMVHLTEENDFIVLKEMNISCQLTADPNFICTNEYCFDFRNSLGSY